MFVSHATIESFSVHDKITQIVDFQCLTWQTLKYIQEFCVHYKITQRVKSQPFMDHSYVQKIIRCEPLMGSNCPTHDPH